MVPETISHYKISSKLGQGGMGAVYRAGDTTLKREVALKFLPAEMQMDKQARERLLKEAQAASRLNHPNIATIYEVSESEDTPFIAMELVTGESLKDVLARGPLPPAQLLDVARQIAEGLNEAHLSGVLHRDIKPGNIMLDSRGRVKILDFGLASVNKRERSNAETQENFITRTATTWTTGGTVPYMSPEQLRGDHSDERSDIFSFGVLLYECLTGRLPFRGETSIDILYAILRQQPTPLRSLLPDISPAWEQLVERCIAKTPQERFQTMKEAVDAFQRLESPAVSQEKSLAVLYFENLSGAQEDEYFRDGITEDIIIELSKIHELKVFPRSAVLVFRDSQTAAAQIGNQLHAAYVLAGSLRRAGNRLRITAQLVETRSGHSVWAERYDRQLEDVFAIQDEIAQNIAKALRLMLSEKEKNSIVKAPTADVQAYDYYLRGRQYFHQLRKKELEFARQMFARATVIDPNYARAYAGVADCCSFMYMYYEASDANLKEADAASKKALDLDPELAEAHASRALAFSLRKQYDEAEQEFQAAIRLNPKLFEAHYFYARASLQQGKLSLAAELFEQACRVRPEDYQAPSLLALVYEGLGDKEKARLAQRNAVEVARKHLEMNPDDARALYLGAGLFARLGEVQQAKKWAAAALKIDPDDSGVKYNVACVYVTLGEAELALDTLQESIRTGFGHVEWLEHDPDFAPIRNTPRFQAMLKDLKEQHGG